MCRALKIQIQTHKKSKVLLSVTTHVALHGSIAALLLNSYVCFAPCMSIPANRTWDLSLELKLSRYDLQRFHCAVFCLYRNLMIKIEETITFQHFYATVPQHVY